MKLWHVRAETVKREQFSEEDFEPRYRPGFFEKYCMEGTIGLLVVAAIVLWIGSVVWRAVF